LQKYFPAIEAPMFRFTIRDALWLTVVVAMAIMWWRDHQIIERVKAVVGPATPGNLPIVDALNGGKLLGRDSN
jgi:hypothetical protein